MTEHEYDIIVIGCGSGGLSVGLFMNKAGFKVLMISKTDKSIGGDCLNDGCVPSKSLLHVSKILVQVFHNLFFFLLILFHLNQMLLTRVQ